MKPSTERRASVELLAAAHGPALLKLGIALTGRRDEAEDLVQLTFERLLAHRGPIDDLLTFARRVLVNATKDTWRRNRTRREKAPALFLGVQLAGVQSDHAERVVEQDRMVTALAQLPEGQRRVVLLRFWVDLTEAQTADALGISVGTVKSQTARALATLRTCVDIAGVGDRGTRGSST